MTELRRRTAALGRQIDSHLEQLEKRGNRAASTPPPDQDNADRTASDRHAAEPCPKDDRDPAH
ncbi:MULTISPECIES: hypothetical protein [unclassified Streptomyces]|uniref:hypothetical protein n=1 Tax=unclassified Streptomyces TaxID=2593676 RepID=UPI0011B09D4C|nr:MULTISPECIES: hypothetical protein [unclassified Streptomyces]